MATSRSHRLLCLGICALLFVGVGVGVGVCAAAADGGGGDDDDLQFLVDSTAGDPNPDAVHDDEGWLREGHDDGAEIGFDDQGGDFAHDDDGFEEFDSAPAIDESDVVVLSDGNFSAFVSQRRHVMVEFYAPWCGHCRALAPEYAAAATELKGEDVALAKVDATEEDGLAQKYDIQGFPTLLFFVEGVHKDYPGARSKDAIVTWIRKKLGPGVQNITTAEAAEKILTSEEKVVLGFLNSLVGAESNELAAASKLEDQVNFYQTADSNVAKLFHIDPTAKRPSLVLLKKEEEKLTYFDGQFKSAAIADFVFANKLPLVTTLTKEAAPSIFNNPIKKQLLLFAVAKDSEKYLPIFQEASKSFKGKLIFVFVERDNEEVGQPVADYFGVTGKEPTVLAYTGNEDSRKFFLDGEISLDNIKKFGGDFLEEKLTPFYKSEPIPETNDGDVKIVVGKNFDDIVLDESKDALLEIYAPWCGHCQALEPIYNKLGKYLRGIDSLVIAKMDGTANEHARAKTDGYPTILFFPAGNKSFEPVTYEGERTVVEFYKFLKKHAAIPFKLKRPASATTTGRSPAAPSAESEKSSSTDLKDEL